MKLIFFSHDSSLYGATRSMINLIVGLKKEGVEVLLFIPEQGEMENLLLQFDISYLIAAYKHWILGTKDKENSILFYSLRANVFKLRRLVQNMLEAIKLRKIVFRFSPDYIISNTSTTPVGFICSVFCRIPHVWHIREFGIEDHGHRFDFGFWSFKWAMIKSHKTFFISKALASKFKFPGIEKKSFVLYNGLYAENELDKMKINLTGFGEEFTFLMLGQVKKSKGHYNALRAMKILLDQNLKVRLLIVGGGELERFKEHAEMLKISNSVLFTGHVQNPERFLKSSNALLICSESEAFGRVIIEAWANGLPVIGNNAGAIPEVIENGHTGLLYNGSPEDLAKKMNQLIEKSAIRHELIQNAIQAAKSRFTIERYTKEFLRFLGS